MFPDQSFVIFMVASQYLVFARKKLSASSISLTNIANASSFISKVARVDVEGLREAKDAHFSIEGHVKSIERRVNALEAASTRGLITMSLNIS